MFITVTSIRLRHWWQFFPLSLHGMKVSLQMKKEQGFIGMKNKGSGYLHYTLSAWETPEDRQRFARSGAHLAAMKQSSQLATELRTLSYEGDTMPTWKEATDRLVKEGKVLKF